MNCSITTKTSVRWLEPAVLAIVLMCSQIAQATEPTGSPDIVAAPHVPADLPDLFAARERESADSRDPHAERVLPSDGPIPQIVAKPRRAYPRNPKVRRNEERARFREAATAPGRYSGRWSTGLILGVGF
jgi:hypothetical protein